MPANSHHVALCTDDPAAVHRFLTEVVGLQVYLEFFVPGENLTKTAGWPENDGAAVVMYGESPGGLVEVIAIPDERWSERPLACLVLKPGAGFEPEAMREHLMAAGFAKWQCPDRYECIDAIPRTSTGKFWKLKLRERFAR